MNDAECWADSTTTTWNQLGQPVTLVSIAGVPTLTLGSGSSATTTVVSGSTYTVALAPTATTTTTWNQLGQPVTIVSTFGSPLAPTTTATSISVSTTTSTGGSGPVTMISPSGGPQLTLSSQGSTTSINGAPYTVVPSSASSVSVSTSTSTGEWNTATLISAATGGPDMTLATDGFVATTVIGSVTYTVSTPSTTVVSTTTSFGSCKFVFTS